MQPQYTPEPALLEPSFTHSTKRGRIYRRASVAERFWPKVLKTDGCWLWIGSVHPDHGYGQLRMPSGVPEHAHRVSWRLHFGPIPDGQMVCHNCDKNYPAGDISYRRCVRPGHLFLGTNLENVMDMIQKRCIPRGETRAHCKLDWTTVREIRRRRAQDNTTYQTLAEEYGVSFATIQNILYGRTWKEPFYQGEEPCPIHSSRPGARLMPEQVRTIRALQGRMSARQAAREFRIGRATVNDIWWGRTWQGI